MQAFGGVAGTRGESKKRGFCGLISAILAKSPAIIMVGNLFDLSGSFCMFPFYLIMFYSRPLLCIVCSARLCHCRQKNTLQVIQMTLLSFMIFL